MTDYRDPTYRDPNYRDPSLPPGAEPWSNSTWGWIAGIAVVVLVLVFIFGSDTTRTANELANPPSTVGQRSTPLAPPAGPASEAPTMNRPAPAPMAPAAPTRPAPAPAQPQP